MVDGPIQRSGALVELGLLIQQDDFKSTRNIQLHFKVPIDNIHWVDNPKHKVGSLANGDFGWADNLSGDHWNRWLQAMGVLERFSFWIFVSQRLGCQLGCQLS